MQAVDNKMDAGLYRAGSFFMLSMQLRICVDAPSRVRSREALRQLTITDVGMAGRDNIYTSYYDTKGTAIILPNDETILHKPPKWLTKESSQDIPLIKAIEYIKNSGKKKFVLHIEDTNFTKTAANPTNATTKLILNELYKFKNRIKINTRQINRGQMQQASLVELN